MLILRMRVSGDRVRIDYPGQPPVWLSLLEIRNRHWAQVGIDAPREVAIYREAIAPPPGEARKA